MKKKTIIQIIALIIIIALISFYFINQNKKAKEEIQNPREKILAKYLEFKVLNENILQEAKERYQKKYELTKEKLLNDPENFIAWVDLGIIKKGVNDYQGAEEAWLHLGEIRPKNSTSFGNLGDLYDHFLKDYPKSEWAYKKAIENSMAEPQNANYYEGLFKLYYFHYLEKKDLAKPTLEEALKNNSDSELLKSLWQEYYK